MRQKAAIFLTSLFLGAALPPPASAALTPPAIPELEPGAGIIKDKAAAIALGKALFWDEQAGSDGMACASCHMSAGADNRIRNQLSPGFNDALFTPGGDTTFGSTSGTGVAPGYMPSGNKADSNYELKKADFPLHQLADYTDRNSVIITTTNDVVSSSGSYDTEFNRIKRKGGKPGKESCTKPDGTIFHAGKYPARQVEPRNTPTTINAAFFHSNFWDGRANNLFNGVGVFGLRDIEGDPNKRLIILDTANMPQLGYLQIRNASLASQAVGPPLSALEMSCDGRTFPDVGRKLLLSAPLHKQKVAATDSVLGPYANPYGNGLKRQHSYVALIKQAFEPRYWAAPGKFRIVDGKLVNDHKGYTQAEINFSMFWGISIMMYERLLISDQSRFDDWVEKCRPQVTNPLGAASQAVPIANPVVTCRVTDPDPNDGITPSTDPTAYGFTAQEALGFGVFIGGGVGVRNAGSPFCSGCHGPIAVAAPGTALVSPVTSEAAYTSGQTAKFTPVERSLILELGDGLIPLPPGPPTGHSNQLAGAMHDRGFFNIGVTPSSVDPGNGGKDPYGNPLSLARMFLIDEGGGNAVDPPLVITPATFPDPVTGVATNPATIGERITLAGPISRCNAPGIIEGGGTPRFLGCGAAPTPPPAVPTTGALDTSAERELIDGGFKTPGIRNIGLTPPYFHSGNYGDLRSVVEFYARGGSRRSKSLENPGVTGDTSGTGPLGKGPLVHSGPEFGTNVDFFVRDIKSTDGTVDANGDGVIDWQDDQIGAMVAFMLTLTDPRVQCDAGPFDHPSLTIRNGHLAMDRNRDKKADDLAFVLPAVGAAGYHPMSGYCLPNKGDLFAPGMQGRLGGPKVPLN